MIRPPKAIVWPRTSLDREHHPVAEAVVEPTTFLARRGQPDLDQHFVRDPFLDREL